MSFKLDERVSETHIKLSTCRGCLHRGKCIDEKYMNQGDYCRDRRTENDVRVEALKSQGWKEVR